MIDLFTEASLHFVSVGKPAFILFRWDNSLTSFLNGTTIKRIEPFGKNFGLIIGENGFNMFVAKDSTYLDSLGTPTDIKDKLSIAENFYLYQNYPNPFSAKGGSASGGNPSTTIRYSIPPQTDSPLLGGTRGGLINVLLKIYDILGNEVKTLVNKQQPAGNYEVFFDGTNLPSGVYFYRLRVKPSDKQTGIFLKTKKLILLK